MIVVSLHEKKRRHRCEMTRKFLTVAVSFTCKIEAVRILAGQVVRFYLQRQGNRCSEDETSTFDSHDSCHHEILSGGNKAEQCRK